LDLMAKRRRWGVVREGKDGWMREGRGLGERGLGFRKKGVNPKQWWRVGREGTDEWMREERARERGRRWRKGGH
jgi:hypothetical protein